MLSSKIKISLALLLALLLNTSVFAQKASLIDKHTVRFTATISPALLSANGSPLYIHGFWEYYAEKQFGIRGDAYFFTGNLLTDMPLAMNHNIFFGGAFHKNIGNFDPYFLLQPGLAFVRSWEWYGNGEAHLTQVNIAPVFSVEAGINYFVSPYFHFYVSSRYVAGSTFRERNDPLSLNELRISAGLGFNFNAGKLKESF